MNKNIFYLMTGLIISSAISFAQLNVKVVSSSTVGTVNPTAGNLVVDVNLNGSSTAMTTSVDISSTAMTTSADISASVFSDYSTNIKSNSDVIVEVTDEDDQVTVSFVEPVKLFGFFSISMKSDVSVDAESKVTVDRPFWAFLATGKSDSSKIESDISAKVPQASASGKLETSTKIQILNSIKSSIDSNITASADTN